jgi:hypothetical protein
MINARFPVNLKFWKRITEERPGGEIWQAEGRTLPYSNFNSGAGQARSLFYIHPPSI